MKLSKVSTSISMIIYYVFQCSLHNENVSFADMVKVLLITLAGRGPFKPYAFLYSRRLSPDTTVRMLRSTSLRAVALFSLISEHVPEERVFFLAVDVSSEAMLHLIHHLSSNQ